MARRFCTALLALSRRLSSLQVLRAGSLRAGSVRGWSVRGGSVRGGSLPAGSLPAGSLPAGSLPAGSVRAGSVRGGSVRGGAVLAVSVLALSLAAGCSGSAPPISADPAAQTGAAQGGGAQGGAAAPSANAGPSLVDDPPGSLTCGELKTAVDSGGLMEPGVVDRIVRLSGTADAPVADAARRLASAYAAATAAHGTDDEPDAVAAVSSAGADMMQVCDESGLETVG